ncbi:hypothetical protein BASA60_003336 [Batrachochytrium salamandrivorans]|nr:hypothetical protein BASA60_003336 [Batrachochytrium salamandrivorans]
MGARTDKTWVGRNQKWGSLEIEAPRRGLETEPDKCHPGEKVVKAAIRHAVYDFSNQLICDDMTTNINVDQLTATLLWDA